MQVFEREAAVTEYEFVCTGDPEKIGWKSLTSGGNSGMIKVRLRINPQFFSNKNIPKMSTLQLEKSIKSWQAEIKGRGDSNE